MISFMVSQFSLCTFIRWANVLCFVIRAKEESSIAWEGIKGERFQVDSIFDQEPQKDKEIIQSFRNCPCDLLLLAWSIHEIAVAARSDRSSRGRRPWDLFTHNPRETGRIGQASRSPAFPLQRSLDEVDRRWWLQKRQRVRRLRLREIEECQLKNLRSPWSQSHVLHRRCKRENGLACLGKAVDVRFLQDCLLAKRHDWAGNNNECDLAIIPVSESIRAGKAVYHQDHVPLECFQ